ncbi:MAG: Fic family protein [Candidatus Paceibacterota bacterium]|jgi:Fic family protein
MNINEKQKKLLSLVLENSLMSSSAIHSIFIKSGEGISLVTVKRALSEMTKSKLLKISGSGPSTSYEISELGRIFIPIDAKKYCAIEPDKRYGLNRYNFNLLTSLPSEIFTQDEIKSLEAATEKYEKRTRDLSDVIRKKELERLVIELAWKSSKIEGNTYTLLDTERLILEQKEAVGHEKKEADMILNHKDAFNFIYQSKDQFQTLTRANLEKLHEILVKNLSIDIGLRRKPVGVVGSKYQPLDNGYQISEAVEALSGAISKVESSFAKALIAILGISYIQPFEDGNKRTSRLMANALLLANQKAPLSYRSVDENEYREAILVFYEINSIIPFKKIFIDQYEFAAANYAVK